MKILIISQPRSGSTKLTSTLGSSLNFKEYHEPFVNNYFKINENNVVVKTLVNQKEVVIGDFDKIILLARKNDKLAGESMMWSSYMNLKMGDSKFMHLPYEYMEPPNWRDKEKRANQLKNEIIKMGDINNIPITWYEDLYSGSKDIVDYIISYTWNIDKNILNLNKLYDGLDPIHKLRKN